MSESEAHGPYKVQVWVHTWGGYQNVAVGGDVGGDVGWHRTRQAAEDYADRACNYGGYGRAKAAQHPVRVVSADGRVVTDYRWVNGAALRTRRIPLSRTTNTPRSAL